MSFKKGFNPLDDNNGMIGKQAKDEDYERYKRAEYAKLAVKSLFAFILGFLISYIIKRL
nr:MAG TPA: Protein of unknown function (DUF1043) [Caudoviricetes sp.]